jgi:hypothetical protein
MGMLQEDGSVTGTFTGVAYPDWPMWSDGSTTPPGTVRCEESPAEVGDRGPDDVVVENRDSHDRGALSHHWEPRRGAYSIEPNATVVEPA